MTVSWRRSAPRSLHRPWPGIALAARLSPHCEQNFAAAWLTAEQAGHRVAITRSQWPHRTASPEMSALHAKHVGML